MSTQRFPAKDIAASDSRDGEQITASKVYTSNPLDITTSSSFSGLSNVLRIIGGFSVVASMSLFLLQGWDAGNDINRYYLLLSQTLLLGLGGFALSYLMKENKGARVFLGLGLLSVSANITTLGALMYSFMPWDGGLAQYPSVAQWSVNDSLSIGLALCSAIAILLPATLFGFKVMARQSAKPLTIVYLLTNAMLLIPVRDVSFAAALAAGMVFFTLAFSVKQCAKDNGLRTAEGKFSRLVLFVPSIILLVRSTWLYQANEVLYSAMGLIVFMALRVLALQMSSPSTARRLVELAALPVAISTAIPAASLFDNLLVANIALPVFALIASALFVEVALRASFTKDKSSILVSASLMLSFSFLGNLLMDNGILASLSTCFVGLIVVMMGHWISQRFIVALGITTSLLGLVNVLYGLLENVDFLNWTSLAILGALAIIIGSVVERHGLVIRQRIKESLKRVKTIAIEDFKAEANQ